jgi:alkylation response protein AidB-like acyl-CoA dehydrogenase
MDLEFTPHEISFRDEVRQFLVDHLTPRLRDGAAMSPGVFVEPEIGQTWNAALQAKGWLAYQWPVHAGGPGWSPVQRYIFEKECALAGAPNLTVLGLKLVGPVIYTFGTEAQKNHYLPRILSGDDYWCQGFSEPGSGSDLASLQCRAELRGDRYIINGTKIWTTHAHHANRIFCLVRTNPEAKRQAGISFLLIDLHQPGVSIRPILTLAGDHEVNQVFFDNAEAPLDALVGAEGQGWAIAKFLLENERGGSCFAPRLLVSLDRIMAAAKDTPDGEGGMLANTTDWKRRVAKLRLSAQALEMIELRILADIAKGRAPGPQTSLALDLHGDLGLQLNMARPLYGDNAPPPIGSRAAQIAAPRYLNSRAWTIFGGTNEVQAGIIARTVLGL